MKIKKSLLTLLAGFMIVPSANALEARISEFPYSSKQTYEDVTKTSRTSYFSTEPNSNIPEKTHGFITVRDKDGNIIQEERDFNGDGICNYRVTRSFLDGKLIRESRDYNCDNHIDEETRITRDKQGRITKLEKIEIDDKGTEETVYLETTKYYSNGSFVTKKYSNKPID